MSNSIVFVLFLFSAISVLVPPANAAATVCGEVVSVATHERTTTRYALSRGESAGGAPIALVLLVGGGGDINLDDQGCPRALSHNILMRMAPLFRRAGFITALVDAPSDAIGGDGLADYRNTAQHAADLAKVIVDVRSRTDGAVWLLGHSRGSLSAGNAAARLTGTAAPDGVVLLSAIMVGDARAKKLLARQSVFDLPLPAIKAPLLMIGHGADNCERSPAALMEKLTAQSQSARQQAVTITGGPIKPGRSPSLAACEVREPHDFVDQEAEVAASVERFIRGASY